MSAQSFTLKLDGITWAISTERQIVSITHKGVRYNVEGCTACTDAGKWAWLVDIEPWCWRQNPFGRACVLIADTTGKILAQSAHVETALRMAYKRL